MNQENNEMIKQLDGLVEDIKHISTIRPYEIFYPFHENPEYARWTVKMLGIIFDTFGENSVELQSLEKIHQVYFEPINDIYLKYFATGLDNKKLTWIDRYKIQKQFKAFLKALKVFFEYCQDELRKKPLSASPVELQLDEMLHPLIMEISYAQYQQKHYKDAILNAINALFQHIRNKTNTTEDGKNLIGKVFSLKNPILLISEIDTSSGENEQQGFIQLFNGLYQGVRNPHAHGLKNDFTKLEATQYLIFISLLVNKIDNAKIVND